MSDDAAAVEVTDIEGAHCIHTGHRVVSEALSQKQSWLPTRLLADSAELNAHAEASCTREIVSAWESAHGFQFAKYPKWLKA